MNKLLLITKTYIGLLLISVLLFCCVCGDIVEATIIGAGTMNFFNFEGTDIYTPVDTISSGYFWLSNNCELEYANLDASAGLLDYAYGLSCDEEFLNAVDETSLWLSCDKVINHDGRAINPNDNLLTIPTIISLTSNGLVQVTFTEEFIDLTEFQRGNHTFNLSMRTDDGLDLKNTGTVFLDFE